MLWRLTKAKRDSTTKSLNYVNLRRNWYVVLWMACSRSCGTSMRVCMKKWSKIRQVAVKRTVLFSQCRNDCTLLAIIPE